METVQQLRGKTCLITGATNGIGLETAVALARAGGNIVLVGRSPQRIEAASKTVRDAGGTGTVDTIQADLSSQAEVRRAAAEFRDRHARLDVLVNNAGGVFMRRETSVDGIEMTFALNHLAYFLLTNLLLDLLIASAPARVINVSSGAHVGGRMRFDDLANPRRYSGWAAYSQSKLANVLFTYELARRLEGKGVTANALHPGFVATNFGRANSGIFNPLFRLLQLGAISPAQGAQTNIYLAASPEVEGVTGAYFDRSKAVRSSAASYNVQDARRLWEESARLTALAD
jgi:NAD(P)-dependent dehydrogenase (short-subunit alcohol dehydrogenase family)